MVIFNPSMQASLFQKNKGAGYRPLADLLRPTSLEEVVGQDHLVKGGSPLVHALNSHVVPSMILWGPPGTGKTTIARIIAKEAKAEFFLVSAVTSGIAELKKIFQEAQARHHEGGLTIVMVDEIHRFNRSQQDVFLPYIEEGSIILIGATTENPSFELNAALLSRCKVFVIHRLDVHALMQLIIRAEQYYGETLPLTEDAKETLCRLADGDGRYLLGLCEQIYSYHSKTIIDSQALLSMIHKRAAVYDKNRDGHYNLISALHKSLRGSDVDAALYWFGRMLEGGEDPLYIVRRLVRFAVEDVGMADPAAILQANAAREAYEFLGSPEGELAIAQCVIYLATAPKSNASYTAYKNSRGDAKRTGSLMPPKHILNAPTALMKEEGYGSGYQYDHDTVQGFSGQNYFPDNMPRQSYYQPVERGFEREIIKRMNYWEGLRKKISHN